MKDELIKNFSEMQVTIFGSEPSESVETNYYWQEYLKALLNVHLIEEDFFEEIRWEYYPKNIEKYYEMTEQEKLVYDELKNKFKTIK